MLEREARGWYGRVGAILLLAAFGCDDGNGGTTPKGDMEVDGGDMGGGGGGGDADLFDAGDSGGGGTTDGGAECTDPCPGNQTQDPDTCECSDADPCEADLDCVGNRICEEGACTAGCAADADCDDPARPMCIAGRCGNCGSDDECFAESVCADGICVEDPSGGCSDSRACPSPDRVCVDGTCTDAAVCNMDCPEGWTCEGTVDCVPARGRCLDAAECPLDLTCVRSVNPPGCGHCQEDDDCPGTQRCQQDANGNYCAESACGEDADCRLGRVCGEDGVCAAPACEDDNFANNNDFASASAVEGGVEHRGLVSCDEDWYRFNIPARTQAVVRVRQADFQANIDLALFDEEGEEIARSATGAQTESATAGPFGSPRDVYVRVWQPEPYSVGAYTLGIDYASADGCVDDRWEAGAGDDTFATGRIVRNAGEEGVSGDVTGALCPGDADFICFVMGRQEQLTVSARVTGGNATIRARLLDDDMMEIEGGGGSWTRGMPGQDIEVNTSPGLHCLEVTADGSGRYELVVDAIPRALIALCDGGEVAELDGDGTFVADGRTLPDEDSLLAPRCTGGRADGAEAVYHVDGLRAGTMLIARVTGLPGGTLGDPVVSVRQECLRANTEVGCAEGTVEPENPLLPQPNPAEVRVPVVECPEDGPCATVVVDGIDPAASPDYRLELRTRPLQAAPRNDHCMDAIALELDEDGVAEVTPSLDRADDDSAACLGLGGPDVTYDLTLDARSRVTVQVGAISDSFAAGAYLVRRGRCGDAPVACGFGFDRVLDAGEYTLVVDGADANARGQVSVQVTVEAFDDAPANDTCDGAVMLAAQGTMRGDTRSAADDVRLADGNGCTGHNTRGGDVVYTLPLAADGFTFVEATPIGGWDLSLIVASDCGDPGATCRAGSDGALTEAVVVADNGGGTMTVIVDGSNEEAGEFDLRWGPADCLDAQDCAEGQRCEDFRCVD